MHIHAKEALRGSKPGRLYLFDCTCIHTVPSRVHMPTGLLTPTALVCNLTCYCLQNSWGGNYELCIVFLLFLWDCARLWGSSASQLSAYTVHTVCQYAVHSVHVRTSYACTKFVFLRWSRWMVESPEIVVLCVPLGCIEWLTLVVANSLSVGAISRTYTYVTMVTMLCSMSFVQSN